MYRIAVSTTKLRKTIPLVRGSLPIFTREIGITEACTAIFKNETKFETITESSAAIHRQRVVTPTEAAPSLFADNAVVEKKSLTAIVQRRSGLSVNRMPPY
jgi:hypothetical protein